MPWESKAQALPWFEIMQSPFGAFYLIVPYAENRIASIAEKAANNVGLVAMIHNKPHVIAMAYSASVALFGLHALIILLSYSISPLAVIACLVTCFVTCIPTSPAITRSREKLKRTAALTIADWLYSLWSLATRGAWLATSRCITLRFMKSVQRLFSTALVADHEVILPCRL